ncbi:MAG: FecR family protein [Leeuwenhoekiella sp.]
MDNYENDIDHILEKAWRSSYDSITEEQVNKSWTNLEKHIDRRTSRIFYRLSLAAAILMLLFSTYYFFEIYNPIITVNNYAMIDKEVNLPDGSLVLLKNGSEIRYNESFSESRGVELEGEAFFNVVKDSLKEFQVKTNHTITRVLGTSFLVNEKAGLGETEVSLYSGKVIVNVNGVTNKAWSIIPGESFIYNKEGEAFVTRFNTVLSFESGNLFTDINEIKLENLFDFLSERFDYKFAKNEFTKDKLVTLRINKSDSLTEILKLLSIINHTKYEIDQTTREVNVFKD